MPSKKAGSRRFWPKRPITPAAPGSNPEKLTLILFLVPTRVLFLARFRFERRNPRLERRSLSLGCHSPAGLTPGRTQRATGDHHAGGAPGGLPGDAGVCQDRSHEVYRVADELGSHLPPRT